MPRATASIPVARSLAHMRRSVEGLNMEAMRNMEPNTTATALRRYTRGLLFMARVDAGG